MHVTPVLVQHGDARVGQRLDTRVDLHALDAAPELLAGLDALHKQIAAEPRRAVHSLFVGPAGSGQALAAASLGKAAGMPVLRIDLSAVVSRSIGETEKNLDRIFDQAESAGSILFFDEADALFGKRTEVHDAHDRYANVETAYLLRKLEAHAGPVIVATGSRTNLDPAFLRRLRHVLEFRRPLRPPKALP